MSSGSSRICCTVMRGFNDENGSWKIICISRRSGTSSFSLSECKLVQPFAELNLTLPASGSMARNMQRARVVLPEPDSPTTPKVSARAKSNETRSTAATSPKNLLSPRTSSNLAPVGAPSFTSGPPAEAGPGADSPADRRPTRPADAASLCPRHQPRSRWWPAVRRAAQRPGMACSNPGCRDAAAV